VLIFAPGFRADEGKFDLTVEMLRWTFPYLLFISLAALAAACEQLRTLRRAGDDLDAHEPRHDRVRGADRAVLRPAWIVLAIGVFVAGIVQLAFQLPFVVKMGLLRRPRWRWRDEGVRKIGRLMLPAIFGSSVSQVAVLLDTLIASFLATGSIAWLYYADRLMEFPLGVFSIALATVILPGLAAQHAAQAPERFSPRSTGHCASS